MSNACPMTATSGENMCKFARTADVDKRAAAQSAAPQVKALASQISSRRPDCAATQRDTAIAYVKNALAVRTADKAALENARANIHVPRSIGMTNDANSALHEKRRPIYQGK